MKWEDMPAGRSMGEREHRHLESREELTQDPTGPSCQGLLIRLALSSTWGLERTFIRVPSILVDFQFPLIIPMKRGKDACATPLRFLNSGAERIRLSRGNFRRET